MSQRIKLVLTVLNLDIAGDVQRNLEVLERVQDGVVDVELHSTAVHESLPTTPVLIWEPYLAVGGGQSDLEETWKEAHCWPHLRGGA